MPIICFFGPDGSGKSTLARILAKRLSNNGFKVKLSWIRGTHTFASVLAKILSKFSNFRGSDNPYYGITIPRSMKGLWQFIEFASILPVLFTKFWLPRLLGYVVIAERLLPDFIVWVAVTTRDVSYLDSFAAWFFISLSSRAKVRVHVTAELTELLRRRSDENQRFLQEQMRLYEKVARSMNAFKLDTTNKSVTESMRTLLRFMRADFQAREVSRYAQALNQLTTRDVLSTSEPS